MIHPKVTMQRIIPWFGAGISILPPSNLPPGIPLTYRWLEYLLNKEDADFIKALFSRYSKYLEKGCPRLEKVIEDATDIYGVEVLNLLGFFKNVEPNINHLSTAEYIIKHKGWAITTNFDSAVENALNTRIPIHTPAQASPENWGILKIHGSIEEDLVKLGHSIRNLIHGIRESLSNRLLMLLEDEHNLFVFVGYSGSDSFDVTPFFAQFSDNPVKARAIWIDHRNSDRSTVPKESLAWGPRTILNAFSKAEVIRGRTEELLLEILGSHLKKPQSTASKSDWKKGWQDRFAPPTVKQKNIFAAKLFAGFGMGIKSLQAMKRNFQGNFNLNPMERQLLLNAARDCGCYKIEIKDRVIAKPNQLETKEDWEEFRKLAAAYRLAKKSIRAFWLYRKLIDASQIPSTDQEISLEQSWVITEAALFYRDFLLKLLSNSFYRVLLYPLRPFLVSKIRYLYDHVHMRYRSNITNPHIIATLERIMNVVMSSGSAPSTGYYRQTFKGRLILEKPASALEHTLHSGAIYNETDSLLGMVNNFRDQGRQLINLVRSKKVEKKSIKPLMESALYNFRRSYRLAVLIDDLPGQIKGLLFISKVSRRLGKKSYAQKLWKLRKRKEKQLKKRCKELSAAFLFGKKFVFYPFLFKK